MEGQRSRWLGEGPYFLTHLPWTQEYLNKIHGFNTALLHSHTCTEATDDIKMSHLDPFFYYVPVVIGMPLMWAITGLFWRAAFSRSFHLYIYAPRQLLTTSRFNQFHMYGFVDRCPPQITYGHVISLPHPPMLLLYYLNVKKLLTCSRNFTNIPSRKKCATI